MSPDRKIVRAVFWRRVDGAGAEYCTLSEAAGGWQLEGTVAQVIDGLPADVRYRVECDAEWRTRWVSARLRSGNDAHSIELLADGAGRWSLDGRELPELDGCLDVDLSVTPATNALPVRRLKLEHGEVGRLTAAWIRFPSLAVEPLEQWYTRLDERRYRYASRKHGGMFSADLRVDDLGLILSYGDGWERMPSSD